MKIRRVFQIVRQVLWSFTGERIMNFSIGTHCFTLFVGHSQASPPHPTPEKNNILKIEAFLFRHNETHSTC